MFYFLYKTTNTVNGKIYIGVHRTNDLDDGYMGSGKALRAAFRKYGKDNFVREILEFFDTPEAMYARERDIVNEDFLASESVYNIRCGGHGGFDYLIAAGKAWRGGIQSAEGKARQKAGLDRFYADDVNRHNKSSKARERLLSSNPMKNKETAAKTAASLKNQTKTDTHKANISAAMTGLKRPQIQCPHCGKIGGNNAMKRFHFDNCKNKLGL